MKQLKLNFNEYNLGVLTYENKNYSFTLNKESSELLLKSGVDLLATESEKESVISKELPLAFKNFLPDTEEKLTMLKKFGILKTDSDFEKLLKIAKLKLNKEGFWLEI
jgi:hypothetical protein